MGMPIVQSILDTDFYIPTMCNAALHVCPNAWAEYAFVDRNKLVYPEHFLARFKTAIRDMGLLNLRSDEYGFLKSHNYLSRGFLEFVKNLRLDPDQVVPSLDSEGHLKISIGGPLIETIWWEVPLMATLSEIYFDWLATQWNYDRQESLAHKKAYLLSQAGCFWADFGTRRRRSYRTQDIVVGTMKGTPGFVGTSNVYLAMKHGVKAIGTAAHQWTQIWSALMGLRHANKFAMDKWVEVFRGDLGIALTDTFGTDAFLADFDLYLANLFNGVRQDSGDPCQFADKMTAHYRSLKIDPMTKTIVFSDNLNVDKVIMIKRHCDKLGIRCSFGIGTSFTNDFEGAAKPLNIVIKLIRLDGTPVVKLSDVPTKAICEDSQEGRDALRIAKNMFYGESL